MTQPPDVAELRRPAPPARIGGMRTLSGGAVAYAGPGRLEYRSIGALDRLGRLAEPHRLRLHAAIQSAPPAPLFEEAAVPDRFVTPHHRVRRPVPPTDIFAVPGHELGAFGLLHRDGRVWVNEVVQPPYLNEAVQSERLALPEIWTGSILRPDAEIIETDGPVGVALHPNMVYGHFLLEMLPRLLLLVRLRCLGCPFPLAVPGDAPAWALRFVSLLFGPDEIIFYDSKRQRLRAPCFILPGQMNHDYHFHPELNGLLEELLGRVVGPTLPLPRPPKRIYLSRRRFGGWHAIENEEAVERALTGLGFATLHPQELPFPEQLAVFAGAECIVGNYSSALHNSLFAPLGTGVVSIDWLNRCQSGIAALRAQPLAYLPPVEGFHDSVQHRAGDTVRSTVDCVALSQQVAAFLRFAEGRRRH